MLPSELYGIPDWLPSNTKQGNTVFLMTSRGCPYNCNFCAAQTVWTREMRMHSPDYIVSEIEYLTKRNINTFLIEDDDI
jgi:radical SAM superfamily enzyme YgiQ (UPF0313 family)